MFDISFYKGKKILITGHTGFKGSWMCQLLIMAGADVINFIAKKTIAAIKLNPEHTKPNNVAKRKNEQQERKSGKSKGSFWNLYDTAMLGITSYTKISSSITNGLSITLVFMFKIYSPISPIKNN